MADALRGKDGRDGRDGKDGKDLEPEIVAGLVADSVKAIAELIPATKAAMQGPPGRDGRDGKDGKDGRDAQPSEWEMFITRDSDSLIEHIRLRPVTT